ncbi:hypothetical protein EUGRSUZ_B02959 [Eucalyptus grandis]|uniref:Uncharacterized protein n=2 Tax=Eucalyptus grandis TaxID=71139 RepID=A0ACC3LGX5_EUCGR|nr:hypothetical protein EUGRSUZ_B02959 [Eucalyptus grandis]
MALYHAFYLTETPYTRGEILREDRDIDPRLIQCIQNFTDFFTKLKFFTVKENADSCVYHAAVKVISEISACVAAPETQKHIIFYSRHIIQS